ncbi:prophage DNA circulation protein [Agrobacterium larrymoorei]|uniref:Prophage DNA circulation protein n=1 Tax=Agrobacterium larrymoorei TaxID=160699 RepID=A0AAJ2BHC1_9HYPH|nr:DNA circularization N-terminal domain-containing protein [Agrobacterium larrymoorei]MDR6102799.1 prophage DNA circulation protein [Agrobacterium larrymoorei]
MFFDSLDKLPGLLPCKYRGLSLFVADTSTEPGRRVLEYLFPGVDAAAYDDFGVLPSVVTIEGLVVADDYLLRAAAFQGAFERPGPGLLIHPWLGPMQVILEEPAQITFSSREMRVVRISATFKRMTAGASGSFGSLPLGVSSAIAAIVSSAAALAGVIGTRVISSSRTAAVTRSSRVTTNAVAAMTPVAGSARAVPQITAALKSSAPGTPTAFTSWVAGAATIIETISEPSAVAPAAGIEPQATPLPQSMMSIGLDLATRLTAASIVAPSDIDRSLLLSAAARFVASACAQSSYAEYASRREALAFRDRITSTLEDMIEKLEAIGSTLFQAQNSALVRSARDLIVAVVIDINEVMGRLPDVLTVRPERSLDAWALALHVAGDNPALMESVYRDIVSRNNPRHPAAIDPGAVEFLDIR